MAKISQTLPGVLQRAVALCFILFFSLVFGYSFITKTYSILSFVLGAALAVLFLFLYKGLALAAARLGIGHFRLCLCAILLLGLALQLYVGLGLVQDMHSYPFDAAACYKSAVLLASGAPRPNEYNDYFLTYSTNSLCMVLQFWWYSLVFALRGSVGLYAGVLLNIFMLFSTGIFVVASAYLLRGRAGCLFMAVLLFFFLPHFLMGPVYYTDSFSAPFAAAGVFFYLLYLRLPAQTKPAKGWRRAATPGAAANPAAGMGRCRALALLATALVLSVGFLMKGNVLVLFIAVMLHFLLCAPQLSARQKLACTACALGIFFALNWLFSIYLRHSGILNYQMYDAYHLPLNHWVMMGLSKDGSFNLESYQYIYQFPSLAAKRSAANNQIRLYLLHYLAQPAQALRWFFQKTQLSWHDGSYESLALLALRPIKNTWLHAIFTLPGRYATLARASMDAMHLVLYANLFLLAGYALRGKRLAPLPYLLLLCLVGNFLFLLL